MSVVGLGHTHLLGVGSMEEQRRRQQGIVTSALHGLGTTAGLGVGLGAAWARFGGSQKSGWVEACLEGSGIWEDVVRCGASMAL